MTEPNQSKPTAMEKGNALERAVRAIESVILNVSPDYAKVPFDVQGKKILSVNGVRHEIDVLVTLRPANGYESVFIFECKNRQDKADKNDIVVFTEKIKVANAQRGFFVARSYTADARAQGSLDSRMVLLNAMELNPSDVILPPRTILGGTQYAPPVVEVAIRFVGSTAASKPFPIPMTESLVINSSEVLLSEYIRAWALNLAHRQGDALLADPTVGEGPYSLPITATKGFQPGAAFVQGKEVRTIEVRGTVEVYIARPVISSAFDVATRGRLITVRCDSQTVKVEYEVVQLSKTLT